VELKPGGGGNYIITADGIELWHKRRMGNDFPEDELILGKLSELKS
jgi:predicted Rdx family selenoprotein